MGDPIDVLIGVDADMGEHRGQRQVAPGMQSGNGDLLAFEIAEALDVAAGEELVAASVQSTENDEILAPVQIHERTGNVGRTEVSRPIDDQAWRVRDAALLVGYVREAFRLQ